MNTGSIDSTDNFATVVESILNEDTVKGLCEEDPGLVEHITADILEFVNSTKRYIQEIEYPLNTEQVLFDSFCQTDSGSFEKLWKTTSPYILENYERQMLDADFFYDEFQKSLSFQTGNAASFQSVKIYFTEKWSGLLVEKILEWERGIIEEKRKIYCTELFKQLEQIKKLREMLDPFKNESGQMWDMSKGRWQKTNFDILKDFAEKLQKDKSLLELAETLGRTGQEEKEIEVEYFTDTVIKPVWVDEPAAKSEFVGVHESDDINSMLPVEAALFADDATELLFYKNYTEKKLQTFEYQKKFLSWEVEGFINTRLREKEIPKGPYIICIDTSFSMHGTPETVAKTLCLALLKITGGDKRKCYLISFSTDIETLEITDLNNNLEKLIAFLSGSFYGGTDGGPAMQEVLETLETKDYKRADVVMVSDFIMPEFDDETRKQISTAKKNRTKFHSIAICSDTTDNVNIIEGFDNNWIYDENNPDGVLRLLGKVD